jgi:transposase
LGTLPAALSSAAWAASHTKETYLAARFRRLAARKGKKRAIGAVAHTILISRYHMLKNKQSYRELGADFLDGRHADQVKRYLLKRLERLGVVVTIQGIESTAALST